MLCTLSYTYWPFSNLSVKCLARFFAHFFPGGLPILCLINLCELSISDMSFLLVKYMANVHPLSVLAFFTLLKVSFDEQKSF